MIVDRRQMREEIADLIAKFEHRITSYNVCYTKLLRSPGIFEMIRVLGKEETLKRLKQAMEFISR